jgi:hypothetical protein
MLAVSVALLKKHVFTGSQILYITCCVSYTQLVRMPTEGTLCFCLLCWSLDEPSDIVKWLDSAWKQIIRACWVYNVQHNNESLAGKYGVSHEWLHNHHLDRAARAASTLHGSMPSG